MSELVAYFAKTPDLELHLILYGINREIFYAVPHRVIVHKPRFTFNNTIRFISTLRTFFYLRKEISKIAPSTILSFGEYWNSFVLLALYGLKYPVFVSDRNQPSKSLGRIHNFLRKKLYPRANGVIAQTQKAKDIYEKLYGHTNIEVIGNPIREMPQGRADKENVILMVGRFIRTKNQDKLIEVFSKIGLPGWKLLLVGYDHLKQQNQVKIERLIQELGMSDCVVLAGKRDDVDDLYATSRIFAFTSTSEGFPNVIGEAMSAGLPVISFDCVAGPNEMIDDNKSGILIPVNDYESFEKKLEGLMNNNELQWRLGNAAKEKIKEFSLERIGDKYFEFITKI